MAFLYWSKSISVRRLEQIRRLYPKVEEVEDSDTESVQSQDISSLDKVQDVCRDSVLEAGCESVPVIDVSVATNTQKLQQFVALAKSIDWSAIQECRESKEILDSMPGMLGLIG